MQHQYTNIAFISYKREDEKWAKWLQDKLQHYQLPIEIRKQKVEFGERPRYVFKDTTDLSGGVLAKAIKNGLDSSKFLIVICSPRAAKSEWVCKEVQEFIDSGREEYIIPFIIDGEPYSKNADKECFPKALKSLVGKKELLGINVNENGRDSAAVKVIAQMFNVRFDTLWQRFQRKQKQRRRYIIFSFVIAIMLVAGIAFWIGNLYHQQSIVNVQLTEERNNVKKANDGKLLNLSLAVASKAEALIKDGEIVLALNILDEVVKLYEDINDIPFEVESAMRRAVLIYEADFFKPISSSPFLKATNGHISISPSAKYIVVHDTYEHEDNIDEISVVNSSNLQPIYTIKCEEGGELGFSIDNEYMFILREHSFSKYRLKDGQEILSEEYGELGMVNFLCNNVLKYWELGVIREWIFENYSLRCNPLSVSPDLKACVYNVDDDENEEYVCYYYDFQTQDEIELFRSDEITYNVTDVVFSSDNEHLFVMDSAGGIVCWNRNSMTTVWKKQAIDYGYDNIMDLSYDNSTILAYSSHWMDTYILNAINGENLHILHDCSMVSAWLFSDLNTILYTTYAGDVRMLKKGPGFESTGRSGMSDSAIRESGFSNSKKFRVEMNHLSLRIMDSEENQELWSYTPNGGVTSVSFSSDEKYLLVEGEGGLRSLPCYNVFDVMTGKLVLDLYDIEEGMADNVCFAQGKNCLCYNVDDKFVSVELYPFETLLHKTKRILDGRTLTDEERQRYFTE